MRDDLDKLTEAMTIRPVFAWYDAWIGMFWDRQKRKLYVFPIPFVGFVITFGGRDAS